MWWFIRCLSCGFTEDERLFPYGRGKRFGRHELHRYCSCCGQSIDWFGFVRVSMPKVA